MKHLLILSILCSLVLFSNCGEDSEDPVADETIDTTDDDTKVDGNNDDSSTDTVRYTLTLTASEGGTVSPESGTYTENDSVELLATPDSTYVFVNWTGSSTSTDNPLSVSMDADKSYTANFTKKQYPLTILIEGEGLVSEEIITNGRLKVNEMSEKGYKVEVLHGKNDFFDKIRGKFLYEAYEPFKITLSEMRYQDTTLCNTEAVRDSEGYCVPLMDLGGVNPIADYQQTIGYYLDFGLNKIADAIGYTYTNNGLDLTDYVFTKSEPPTFDTRATSFVSNRRFAAYEEIGEEQRLIWSHVMTVKGVLNFQQMLMRVISGAGLPNDPDINILVNGVVISTYTITVNGPLVNTSFNSTPTEYNAGDIIQIMFDATGIGSSSSVYLVDAYFKGYYTLGYKVYHENILGEYTQTDFVRNIMQTFNLGVNVNAIANTVELYSLNTVYSDSGIVNDLSKYYHKTDNRIFNSSYGKKNKLKYKYVERDSNSGSADGIIEANNTNEDKTIIESELTASLNFTPITLGAVDALLTTVDAYDSQSINARTSNIGDRFNQVVRVETTGADPVNVSYKDKNGTTTTVTSDQTFLTFGGLDWSTLIDTQFNNLRDKVLNRYEKYTVIMNVPLNVINEYDFKEKVYIRELGSNFVVNNITTLKGGLNKWELIKIN